MTNKKENKVSPPMGGKLYICGCAMTGAVVAYDKPSDFCPQCWQHSDPTHLTLQSLQNLCTNYGRLYKTIEDLEKKVKAAKEKKERSGGIKWVDSGSVPNR